MSGGLEATHAVVRFATSAGTAEARSQRLGCVQGHVRARPPQAQPTSAVVRPHLRDTHRTPVAGAANAQLVNAHNTLTQRRFASRHSAFARGPVRSMTTLQHPTLAIPALFFARSSRTINRITNILPQPPLVGNVARWSLSELSRGRQCKWEQKIGDK